MDYFGYERALSVSSLVSMIKDVRQVDWLLKDLDDLLDKPELGNF